MAEPEPPDPPPTAVDVIANAILDYLDHRFGPRLQNTRSTREWAQINAMEKAKWRELIGAAIAGSIGDRLDFDEEADQLLYLLHGLSGVLDSYTPDAWDVLRVRFRRQLLEVLDAYAYTNRTDRT